MAVFKKEDQTRAAFIVTEAKAVVNASSASAGDIARLLGHINGLNMIIQNS